MISRLRNDASSSSAAKTGNGHNGGRRHGRVYTESTQSVKLRPVKGGQPVRSIMKVGSLEDSLRSAPKEGPLHKLWSRSILSRKSSSEVTAELSYASDFSLAAEGEAKVDDTTSPEPQRTVRYDAVHMRAYPILVEDNPGVSKGPAIGIGWQFDELETIRVEEFENNHPPRRKLREIKMSQKARLELLRKSGIPQAEVDRSIKRSNAARKKRRKTIASFKTTAKVEENLQSLNDNIKTKLRLKRTDEKEEEALWDKAQITPKANTRKRLFR